MPNNQYQVSSLPVEKDFYKKSIFTQLVKTSRALAELKGEAKTITYSLARLAYKKQRTVLR
jgi:hypothetical protein